MKKYLFNKMSTGKRLAKRSIIGMRVSALCDDGLYYPGKVHTVKTPPSPRDNQNCINLTPYTKYTVRFDPIPGTPRRGLVEYRESELIGPGFRSVNDVRLNPGQRVYITYNGRENSGDVMEHDEENDEVNIKIHSSAFNEAPLELKKKIEEVRLLESRRSARLADQERDTDFARLADMAGDRRRTSSQCIDVPCQFTQHNSRKRRTSYTLDEHDFSFNNINDDQMNECNAALVLMSLSCSPNSPKQAAWENCAMYDLSPGGMSTWSTGSSSPPLSDDGISSSSSSCDSMNNAVVIQNSNTINYFIMHQQQLPLQMHHQNLQSFIKRGERTTSLSTSDEGIVMDYNEEMPRKKRATIYKCTWKTCGLTFSTDQQVKSHVKMQHLGPDSSDDVEFYFTDTEDEAIGMADSNPAPPSPPTLSHRDMARPPHEDPEYQRKYIGNIRQELLQQQGHGYNKNVPMSNTTSVIKQTYTWSSQTSPTSPQKHVRLSPRPSTSFAPYPQLNGYQSFTSASHSNTTITKLSHSSPPQLPPPPQQQAGLQSPTKLGINSLSMAKLGGPGRSPLSPNRRTRGENKKCRKVYGMENRDQWCTQCKWKKACSRFGD